MLPDISVCQTAGRFVIQQAMTCTNMVEGLVVPTPVCNSYGYVGTDIFDAEMFTNFATYTSYGYSTVTTTYTTTIQDVVTVTTTATSTSTPFSTTAVAGATALQQTSARCSAE